MSTLVLLQPAGDGDAAEHYVDTILKPVVVSRILPFLEDEDRTSFQALVGTRSTIPMWGVTLGANDVNLRKWNRVQRGDVALFSRTGRIFSSATVLAKVRSERLALDLWTRNADGETWECVYFLDELQNRNISYEEFNAAVGYAPGNIIRGFNVLDEERSRRVLEAFELYSDIVPSKVSEIEYAEAIRILAESGTLELERVAWGRKEQAFLRDHLFEGKATDACCMCGNVFPVELLVVAHVKKRASCSLQEKLDFKNIVAPMCRMGCDELYERGFLAVDPAGRIIRLSGVPITPALEDYLARVAWSQVCSLAARHKHVLRGSS